MKKLNIVFLCLLFALLGFIYVQKNNAEERLNQLLHSLDIKFDALALNIFPTKLEINNILYQDKKERSFFFEKSEIQLSLPALIMGDLKFQQADLHNGKYWRRDNAPDYQQINITLGANDLSFQDVPTLLAYAKQKKITNNVEKWQYFLRVSGENRKKNTIAFETQINLQDNAILLSQFKSRLHLEGSSLFNNQDLQIEIGQGKLEHLVSGVYQLRLEGNLFNKQAINLIEGKLNFADEENQQDKFTLKVNEGNLILTRSTFDSVSYWLFDGKNLPIDKLLNAFNLPAVVEGKADLVGKIYADKLNVERGDFRLAMNEGKFKGLNLLQLAASYLPINYDEGSLQQRDLNTNFQKMTTDLDWREHTLTIQNMEVLMGNFSSVGKGEVDLAKMQCDFLVTLNVNQDKYNDFKLPIRFFDDCTSPQYKVEFDKNLRNSLKNMLKERLK